MPVPVPVPAPVLVGIDIGASKLALALGDESGRPTSHWRRAMEATDRPADDLARIAEDVRELLAGAGKTAADVDWIGVSAPGPMDRERGRLLQPPNLPGWKDVPIQSTLAEALGAPVRLENDANAAALAEWRHGAGQGFENVVYLTASTGIGAGLVLGGRLHRGRRGNAGEIGHAPVEWDGAPCVCGQRGCLEAYVGGAAWTRRLREITPESSQVARLAGDVTRVRPEHVVAAAKQGDVFARSEMDRFNRYLARAIVTLAFALEPDVVVLGTIPVSAGEALCFAPLRERVAAQVWPVLGRDLQILPAALGSELPYYAGLCLALEGRQGR